MFERNKILEEIYDENKIIGWSFKYTPILYALNIVDSLQKKPPNGRYISRRQKLILNLNLNDYEYSSSVSDAVNDYITLAVNFLKNEQKKIKNLTTDYFVKYTDQEYLVDCYYKAMIENSPLPDVFTKFECGWFVSFPYYSICFLDSSLKGQYQNLASIFRQKLCLCIMSADFDNNEIQQLFTLGPVSKIIFMSNGGHVIHYHYSTFFDDFSRSMNHLVWRSNDCKNTDFISDDKLRFNVTSTAKRLINKIDSHKHELVIYFDVGYKGVYVEYHLINIKSSCEELIKYLLVDEYKEHLHLISKIDKFIEGCNYRTYSLNVLQSLESAIIKYAHVISQNKYLYKIEHGSTLFMETNISGIYKELLSAGIKNDVIDFTQEELNGNGRTDIQIKHIKQTIGIIEVKLLKPGEENRTNAIRTGLDQLYERYSKNHYRRVENNIILKLVLFCYDPNFGNLLKTIENAIVEHESRVGVKFTTYSTQKRNVIRIKLEESNLPLKTRIEHIDIVIIKLENNYNRDRLAKKNFKIS